MTPFTLGVLQDPLRQATCGALMKTDHAPMPMELAGAEAVAIVNLPKQPFDGLNKCITRVAITLKLLSIPYYRVRLAAQALAVFSTDSHFL